MSVLNRHRRMSCTRVVLDGLAILARGVYQQCEQILPLTARRECLNEYTPEAHKSVEAARRWLRETVVEELKRDAKRNQGHAGTGHTSEGRASVDLSLRCGVASRDVQAHRLPGPGYDAPALRLVRCGAGQARVDDTVRPGRGLEEGSLI